MKKKIALMLLSATMVFGLAACGGSSNNAASGSAGGSETSTAESAGNETQEAAPAGEVKDTGKISVEIPDGWTAVDYPDVFEEYENNIDPYQLYVIKGGDDVLSYPYIWITYIPNTTYWEIDASDLYEDYKEIDSMEFGGETWSGYSYTSLGYPGVYLHKDAGDGYVTATVMLENGDNKITIEDEDVKAIISSFKVTDTSSESE